MKRILITGANSYIGTNVERWLMKDSQEYYIETLDMTDPNWNKFDFSNFDVVFHVAGIAHVSSKKSMEGMYYKINRDLAYETAIKAKQSNVKHFIFMSSLIVYSSSESKINSDVIPKPDNFYGESKLQAENLILQISSDDFAVSIIRAPFIYGPNCKGNYPALKKFILLFSIVPTYKNKKSSLYIGNLVRFIELCIEERKNGILFPKDATYFSIYEFSIIISKIYRKRKIRTKIFNTTIKYLIGKSKFINKIYGDYYIDNSQNNLINFSPLSFEEGIYETENTH